jgi:hypothetical protein
MAKNLSAGIDFEKTTQGYPYTSGGVGIEERDRILKQAHHYDLELSFADKAGHYLSDVNVTIAEPNGNPIITTRTDGPLFFIELPDGQYDVKATFDHQTEEIKNLLITKGRLMTRLLHWNDSEQRISQR